MKVSNLEDVGQMRSRRGISMKTMMIELALGSFVSFGSHQRELPTYRQRAPKRIKILKWNRCDMPRAKQRKIHITPVLPSAQVSAIVQ
jgi:hypothetical protein